MKSKLLLAAWFLVASFAVNAQTPTVTTPGVMPFGKIDKADLELKSCDFEKDANAMVLFDKANIYYTYDRSNGFTVNIERHRRIKIFNNNGKRAADVRIEFINAGHLEYITGLQAETINLNNGEIEITKLDKKTLVAEVVDKLRSAYVFSLPNIRPGSVIDLQYTSSTYNIGGIPIWNFQNWLPVRYSELTTQIPDFFYFRPHPRVVDPFIINKTSSEPRNIGGFGYSLEIQKLAMANLHSLSDEPYMRSVGDNLQRISYQLVSFKPLVGITQNISNTWTKVGEDLTKDQDFGDQFNRRLSGEDALISKAQTMATDREKIAYLFSEVRNSMKWNGVDTWYTNDGTVRAWEKKSGNSAEVNLSLYHLLKQAGVTSYPMVVSTRKHGMVDPAFTSTTQFNRAVVYVPIDTTSYYILDATGKYNMYNEIPDELLNSSGLYISKEDKASDMIFIQKNTPPGEVIVVSANVAADGKLDGSVELSCGSYNKINALQRYKTDGEQKYLDFLRNNDNTIKLTALKLDNMDVDTLPLSQSMHFKQELTASDGNFIYFVPSLFTPLRTNPFINEKRATDIDFGYRDNFTMTGTYKLPSGFKSETLPKNVVLEMPDKSIVFRRMVVEQEGTLMVRYTVDHKQTIFFKENYAELRDFYKKMSEMLNEQIVLKKSS